MKLNDIKGRTDEELTRLIEDSRKEFASAVIDMRTKEVKNVKAQTNLKKTIARALTVKRERELSATEEK